MKFEPANDRGFYIGKFKDANGVPCSLQESSAVGDEDAGSFIWLGASEIGLTYFIPFKGWQNPNLQEVWPEADGIQANTRMHLSQADVQALLPALQHFAKTGQLPSGERRMSRSEQIALLQADIASYRRHLGAEGGAATLDELQNTLELIAMMAALIGEISEMQLNHKER